jgi:DNA polymerase I
VSVPVRNYGYIRSTDELAKLMNAIGERPDPLGFDIETGYEGPPREKGALAWHHGTFIVGFSFTTDPKWARYVPLRHDFCDQNLDPDTVWEIMQPVLEQPRVVAHNLKFERTGLRTVGIEIGSLACTMLQAYVLSGWAEVGQKFLVEQIFGHQQRTLADLFPGAKKKELDALRFNALGLTPDVVAYGCEDSSWCLALHKRNLPKIEADPKLLSVYRMEMGIMEMMVDSERHGVGVDWPTMEEWLGQATQFVAALEDEVRADFGALLGRSLVALNVKSPHQLRTIFFEDAPQGLGITPTRWTDGGEKKDEPVPSTDEIALNHLVKRDKHTDDESCKADIHENCTPDPVGQAVKKLLTAREVDNYRKRLELWLDMDPKKYPNRGFDDRVHSNYAQTIVGTGRFAADKPAIQQLPKKFDFSLRDGRSFKGNFRDTIVASPGYYLCGFDYSQIELRAVAGLAQERSLIEAFKRGDDVHTLTAALMLGKAVEDVDEEKDRPKGKTMNFAIIYQMGVKSLAARLGIRIDEAQVLFDSYWASFPAIAAYVNKSKKECMSRNPPHTRSYFGRRWTIWNLANSNVSKAQYANGERQSVNAPVQGWAADYTKIAMLRAVERQKQLGWYAGKTWLLMNQHDALIYEVSEDIDPADFIREMRAAVEFPVRGFPEVETEWEFGYRWGSMLRVSRPRHPDAEFMRQEDGRWGVAGEAPLADRDVYIEDEVEHDFHEIVGPALPDDPAEVGDLRPVVVEIGRDPTTTEVHALARLFAARPGPYEIVLKTPEGEAVLFSGTAVGVGDASEVSLVVPGASVYHPEGRGIDMALVAEVL